MIVVVASSYDAHARSIVAHWESGCATMLTAEDLCRPGWSVSVPRSGGGAAVIGGRIVRPDQISGILTLRPESSLRSFGQFIQTTGRTSRRS